MTVYMLKTGIDESAPHIDPGIAFRSKDISES